VYHVTTNADSGPGSLRDAIAAANTHPGADSIVFDGRQQTITLTSGELLITDDLQIRGLGARDLTVSGNNHSRVFEVMSGTTDTISGLTITSGNGVANNLNGHGGGILSFGTLTVSNCILQNNTALAEGGGIANLSGTLTVSGSILQYNFAGTFFGVGGGGSIVNTGTGTVSDCTLIQNSAGRQGGGILNSGTLTVRDSTLSFNGADSQGGGIYNDHGVLTLNNSTITGNLAFFQGGGILNDQGVLTLNNSTIAGNQGGVQGGGIYNASGTLYFQDHSTVCGNLASLGGDLYNDSGSYTIDVSSIVCLIYG
jgi:hypothetical protein